MVAEARFFLLVDLWDFFSDIGSGGGGGGIKKALNFFLFFIELFFFFNISRKILKLVR